MEYSQPSLRVAERERDVNEQAYKYSIEAFQQPTLPFDCRVCIEIEHAQTPTNKRLKHPRMNGGYQQHPNHKPPPPSSSPSPKAHNLHHHPSDSNLMQDETMMERPGSSNNSASQRHQSAGLSSNPDDDNRTEATSNVSIPTLPDPYHHNRTSTSSPSSSITSSNHPVNNHHESLSSLNTAPIMPSRSVSLTSGVFAAPDDDDDDNKGGVTTTTTTTHQPDALLDAMEWEDDDIDSVGSSAEDVPFLVDDGSLLTSHNNNNPASHPDTTNVLLEDDSSHGSDDEGTEVLAAALADAERRDSTALLNDYHQDLLANENDHFLLEKTATGCKNIDTAAWGGGGGGTDEDDYDNLAREQPEGGVLGTRGSTASQLLQDRNYENVEYKKCMGRLTLSGEALQFFRWEEATLSVPWKDVIKIQISPASYSVPMMRVKTAPSSSSSSSSEDDTPIATNYMFRLSHPQMADALRDDIRNYPIPMEDKVAATDASRASMISKGNNNDANNKRASFWADVEKDLLRSSAVASSTAASVQPYARDKAVPLLQETDHDQSASESNTNTMSDGEMHGLLTSVLMTGDSVTDRDNTDKGSPKSGKSSNDDDADWDDEEEDDDDADWESIKRPSASSNADVAENTDNDLEAGAETGGETEQQKALREYNEKVARDNEARIERRLFNCFLITCCVSAIIFVVIGGVSGYFIGKNQGSTNSSSDKNVVLPATPVPTVMGNGTGIVTPRPSVLESPPTTTAPTAFPSPFPTVDITNRTLQPTLRGLPPRPEPTAPTTPTPTVQQVDTSSPTIATSSPTAGTSPPTSDLMVATVLPTIASSLTTQDTLLPTEDMQTLAASNETMTQAPTGSPTISATLLTLIRERSSDNGTALDTQGLPQNQAYEWVTVDDAAFSEQLTEEKQLQRYSLATFYFSTGGEEVWNAIPTTRQEASGGSWMLLGVDECEWDFVVCAENQEIVALELLEPAAPDLSGTLANEIGLLTSLTQFVIATNEERSMTRLAIDDALVDGVGIVRQGGGNGNMITGPLPSEVGLLKELQTLTITNQGLSGAMPGEVGGMSALVYFDVTNNEFRGPVPSTFGALSQLQELQLGFNNFQTELSPALFNQEDGMSQSLQYFNVQNNLLRGAIPSEIGLLTSITTGLFLQRNRFTGRLPSEIGQLQQMLSLRLTGNALGGEVPEDFARWNAIQEFRINANAFSGEIPGDLCRLFVVRGTESYADCEEITCVCCTHCCVTGSCTEQ